MADESFRSILQGVWGSLQLERDEINPELMLGHWAPIEEVESLAREERGGGQGIWSKVSKISRTPRGYGEFFQSLDSIEPPEGYVKVDETYETKTRLIVGSGLSGWERSLVAMLKPYSVPWIPGSSLKGAMRNLAEERDLAVDTLFGTKEMKGSLITLGGFAEPSDESLLTVEVITPHYKWYYERRVDYPHEFLEPVPINMAMVKEGVKFRFIVMAESGVSELVRDLLDETLIKKGLGGKRSAGYGLFRRRV